MAQSKNLLLLACCAAASCTQAVPHSEPVAAVIPTLNSTEPVVRASIDGGPKFDWTITPELNPDQLVVQCAAGKTVEVVFQSDLGTQAVSVAGFEGASVNIVAEEQAGVTEVKCTMPARNYDGSYAPNRDTAGDYEADLKPVFDAYIYPDEPGGMITIWEKGELAFSMLAGDGEVGGVEARQVDMPFDIASVTKEFTAVSILKLIEEEKLSFETPLETFFPGLPNGDQVTIYHLLTHTHGLPDYSKATGRGTSGPLDKTAALAELASKEAYFLPGAQYEYGNTSFFLLALIVEEITGAPHSAYVRENLFAPAGMDQSYFLYDETVPKPRVQAFRYIDGEAVPYESKAHPSNFLGSGGIASTFGDLQKWYRALTTGEIISKEMLAQAMTRQTLADGTLIERGFGFFADEYDGQKVIYNSGDHETHTRYIYFVDQDRFVGINTHNTIEFHEYVASELYLHVVGKMLNRTEFFHYGEDIEMADL